MGGRRRRRMELLSAAMEGWSEDDVLTFERLMSRFADGVASQTDAGADKGWADKGWAAVAPRIRPVAVERSTEDFAPGGTCRPREHRQEPGEHQMSTTEPATTGGAAPETGTPQYLSHKQILVVLGGLMAGMFLAALDQSIVGTALPQHRQ